jgi:fucose 4-O-acetylase-like acetyltransferase
MRRLDIDRAKGLAITLVVFGHIVARHDPAQVEWYQPLRRAVYGFHMPFFFYLSGMVSWLAGHVNVPPAGWARLARGRARRLLMPFAAMGLLIISGKLLASRFMYVDNAPHGLIAGLIEMVWSPARSPAYSLWYLAVLCALSLITPMLAWLLRGRLSLLVLVFAALELATPPSRLYLADICRYGLFYALGIAAGAAGAHWTCWIDRWRSPLLGLFAVGFASIALMGQEWPFDVRLLVFGVIAMPAVHSLVRSSWLSSDHALAAIGRYSLMIYLFNTIFIGLTKGLLLHVTSWNGDHFPAFAVALMLAGLLGPIVLKRRVLRAFPPLDRMTE